MERRLFVRGLRIGPGLPEAGWPGEIPAVRCIRRMGELRFSRPVTFFAGENGTGKSTLLEAAAVAMGFNPEGGTINFRFSTCDTHSQLDRYLTVVRGPDRPADGFFLRAESFYNVATNVDQLGVAASYGGSLHGKSHGESFLALAEQRFSGQGLYVLDEPEAALSPAGQLRLLCCIRRLETEGAQLLIATHAPILLAYPAAEIFQLDAEGIRPVAYRETASYQLTRRFLEQPERMLRELFDGPGGSGLQRARGRGMVERG